MIRQHLRVAAVVLAVALCGCAPAANPASAPSSAIRTEQPAIGPTGTLHIALAREPSTLNPKFVTGGGAPDFNWMFNAPLSYADFRGVTHPVMAREVPSQDNGEWVANPDGSMVTTYHLRDELRWHDGVPITAQDFVFGAQVYLDPNIPTVNRAPESLMTGVVALDDRTLEISWSEPYIYANELSVSDLPPLPRHRLEAKYEADKSNFAAGPEWTSAYVGTGPFRVSAWDSGVRIVAEADRDWVLGAPHIATIEIRFISDANALTAALLTGDIDYTASPSVGVTQAVAARDQWTTNGDGYIKTWAVRMIYLEFQYQDVPGYQVALRDQRVRAAMYSAIDRAGLTEAMTSGLSMVADAWVLPADGAFQDVARAITPYPFDPQRARALLADAQWRGQPGELATNPGGQTLDVEMRSGDVDPKAATIIADNWKQVGVNGAPYVLPQALVGDARARNSFPGTQVGMRTVSIDGFHLLTSRIPTAAAPGGSNRGGFSNAEVDRLNRLAVTSLDESARQRAVVAMNQRLSDIVAYGPLYYQTDFLLARTKLRGPLGGGDPVAPAVGSLGSTWNVYEWELAP
ncbi:MAG: peptide/nickel transport system substrate-binding protein [Chloroflexota bacterium]|jgi:peptide/nickel transport system substrate-binding protein|nr:peptide/nickel transport system substrate-binding protein [Chloroflexota bacterium]